jgi:hypothetical protein
VIIGAARNDLLDRAEDTMELDQALFGGRWPKIRSARVTDAFQNVVDGLRNELDGARNVVKPS